MCWSRILVWATAAKPLVDVFAALATIFAALWAACTYRRSVKLQRAKWLKELYEKFYESDKLKKVRDTLDGEDAAEISALVKGEDYSFTDYLNFFEFIAYLVDSGQITQKEMQDLFKYYLQNLLKNEKVKNYIYDRANGFEKLQKQLKSKRLTA